MMKARHRAGQNPIRLLCGLQMRFANYAIISESREIYRRSRSPKPNGGRHGFSQIGVMKPSLKSNEKSKVSDQKSES